MSTRLLLLVVARLLLLLGLLGSSCRASESPERECCDLVYPPQPTSRLPTLSTPTGKSDDKTVAILNCLYARKLCFEHPSCSAILETIPRVCGPEVVACSTVTVTKCQVALKSLQAFEFFKPTCLCREPHVDPECNSFRDFLFDHPCIYKEKDPNAQDSLPTCTHAHSACKAGCLDQYKDYKKNCLTREGKCRMENRDACHESWTQLRLSPLFGCICPGTTVKKHQRCAMIFSSVHHNPCVDDGLPYNPDNLSGSDQSQYGGPVDTNNHRQELWNPPTSTYPYFLFPARGTAGPRLSSAYYQLDPELASSLEQELLWQTDGGGDGSNDDDDAEHKNEAAGRPKLFLYDGPSPKVLQDPASSPAVTVRVYENDRWQTQWLHVSRTNPKSQDPSLEHDRVAHRPSLHHRHHPASVTANPSHPGTATYYPSEHNSQHASTVHRHRHHHHHHYHQHNQHQPALAPEFSWSSSTPANDVVQDNKSAPRPDDDHERTDDDQDRRRRPGELDEFWKISKLPVDRLVALREAFEGFIDSVNVISNSDNTTTLELMESQLENPLIDPDHQDLHSLKQLPIPNIQLQHHHRMHNKHRNNSHATEDAEGNVIVPSISDNERIAQQPVRITLTSTCHHAYSTCEKDSECRGLVQPVLNHCEHSKCHRKECMKSLQHFYKAANTKHTMEIGFCLCKKSEGGSKDDCSRAKEKMHPSCALSVPQGAETPTCDALAESCRKDPGCKPRLERYETSCAVDSVTKKCAGPTLECRKALLGILGTELRSTCACSSLHADLRQYVECIGWQRLLWVNSCVVEAQKDFHALRNRHHVHPNVQSNTLRPPPPTAVATSPTTEFIPPEPTQPTPVHRPSSWPSVVTPKASLVAATSLGLAEQEEVVEEEEVVQQVEDDDNIIPEIMTVGKLEPITDPPTTATEATTELVTTEKMTTTTTTTTTTPAPTTPSTIPPRFCVVQKAHQSHQYIRVGKAKRLYSQLEPECSELCQCSEGEVLTCTTICINATTCKTDFASYNHAAPAYQAFRGRCVCYSGRFICMRPTPDTYSIPHGIFMFLGYSAEDENKMRPLNNITVLDAVSSLNRFMREESHNDTLCRLYLINQTNENVIAAAKLATDTTLSTNMTEAQTLQHLNKIKNECATRLQSLSEKINNHHQDVHTHPLISIFKISEVEIKLPRTSSASRLSSRSSGTSVIVVVLSLILSVSSFSTS